MCEVHIACKRSGADAWGVQVLNHDMFEALREVLGIAA